MDKEITFTRYESVVKLVTLQYKNRYEFVKAKDRLSRGINLNKATSYFFNVSAILRDISIPVVLKMKMFEEQEENFNEAIVIYMDSLLCKFNDLVFEGNESILDIYSFIPTFDITVSGSDEYIPNLYAVENNKIPQDRWNKELETISDSLHKVLETISYGEVTSNGLNIILGIYLSIYKKDNFDSLIDYLNDRAVLLASS